jgi:hypothetical protein
MVNPHFCYAGGFVFALAMYPLRWSTLYPQLSRPVVVFLVLTISLHIAAGILLMHKKTPMVSGVTEKLSEERAIWVTIFLYVLWLAEFIYAGGVPLFEIIFKRPYDYETFGIPSLHVFIVTFGSFYTIFLFGHYLETQSRRLLFLFLFNLIAAILIYNRGMFLFNVAACTFVFLIKQRRISLRHACFGVAGILVISYLFGVMGNLRVSNESRVPYSNEGFLATGGATERFRNTTVPQEFFWPYIYTTSPLANFQQNINVNEDEDTSVSSFLPWFINEVLPDFLSKRINAYAGLEPENTKTIPGPFNATTVYSGSFSYAGWWGVALMAIIIMLLPIVYCWLVPQSSPFFLSGFAVLGTIYLFMIFDNTLKFTGFSFQLIYPIILTIGCRQISWVNAVFFR